MELYPDMPYWIVKNPLYDYFHPLKKDYTVDVAIIGAGITGALIAYELGRLGIDCCVVDKRSIGTGSSAAGMALLQYEQDIPLCRLVGQVGEKAAVTACKACLRSITDLENILADTRLRPEFERLPSICYASDEKGLALLESEYALRQKHHLPTELLSAPELFRHCRFEAEGALVHKEAAQIDTYQATVGLLKYLMHEKNMPVFTHTEIKRWITTPRGCELMTDKGYVIECNYIVVASSFETSFFLPRPLTRTLSTYALVSHPVDTRWLWPRRSVIWETSDPHLYIRTAGRNRIIIGSREEPFSAQPEATARRPVAGTPGRENPTGWEEAPAGYTESPADTARGAALSKEKIRKLEKKFMKLFPHFIFTTEMAWRGTAGTTPDGLPYIGTWPGRDRMYFALGYGRNDIAYGMIAAQLIGKSLRRLPDERASVFGFERHPGLRRAV